MTSATSFEVLAYLASSCYCISSVRILFYIQGPYAATFIQHTIQYLVSSYFYVISSVIILLASAYCSISCVLMHYYIFSVFILAYYYISRGLMLLHTQRPHTSIYYFCQTSIGQIPVHIMGSYQLNALSYQCMRPSATGITCLKLLVYEALSLTYCGVITAQQQAERCIYSQTHTTVHIQLISYYCICIAELIVLYIYSSTHATTTTICMYIYIIYIYIAQRQTERESNPCPFNNIQQAALHQYVSWPHTTIFTYLAASCYCVLCQLNGKPSESNPYLFNGDFVDRGSFSVEVLLGYEAFSYQHKRP